MADASPVSWTVYDVRPSPDACALNTGLSVGKRFLENRRYRMTLSEIWLLCRGQTLAIPAGEYNRIYFLAASANGDQEGAFIVHRNGERTVECLVQVRDWSLLIGQWESRLTSNTRADGGPQIVREYQDGKVVGIENMKPAYVKRDNIAWVGTHRHSPDGDRAYLFCYLFKYGVDVPTGALSDTLPNNPNIRVTAMTAARIDIDDTRPAEVLFEPELTDETIPQQAPTARA